MTAALDTDRRATGQAPPPTRRRFPRRPGARALAGLVLLLVAAGAAVAVTDPFGGGSPSGSGAADNGTATALATVTRQDLTSQTQVDGTLGYAG